MDFNISQPNPAISSFVGGGIAGIIVDMSLYPLDTIKTRLQAEQGFQKAGGFKNIYKGIGPQAIGSAPQAALFFLTYESIKYFSEPIVPKQSLPIIHMFGASLGEVAACLVRVPVEIVKQRKQTQTDNKSSIKIALAAYKHEGVRKGLYRGFGSTLIRDMPFSVIQFPILEYLKTAYKEQLKNNIPLESWEVAICGSIAGGISAAATTPLDVVKTRIMLADRKQVQSGKMTVMNTFRKVYQNEGIKGLFAGILPRTLWITLGGYIFFGSYDFSKNLCHNFLIDSYVRQI